MINGGGGQNPQPSPTPAPGNTPIPFPTTVPVPGDIPTFKELVAPALAGGAAVINMTQGAWECMGKAVSSLWNKMLHRPDNVSSSVPSEHLKLIESRGFPYYAYTDDGGLLLMGEGSFASSNFSIVSGFEQYRDGVLVDSGSSTSGYNIDSMAK